VARVTRKMQSRSVSDFLAVEEDLRAKGFDEIFTLSSYEFPTQSP
jgi:hypothetical protein